MKACPRCNFKIQEEQTKCPNCDVIFAQWFAAHAPSPTDTPAYNFTSDIDLNRARMIAWVLVIISTVGCLAWMFLFFPPAYDPLAIPLIAAIPWIAIGLFRICGHLIDSDAGSPEMNLFHLLSSLIFVPGVILFFIVMQVSFGYAVLFDNILFIVLFAVSAFFMMCCLAWAWPGLRKSGSIVACVIFLIPYPFAVIKYANVNFDRSRPEKFSACVLTKHYGATGKSSTIDYYITVSPWGPNKDEREFIVDKSEYKNLEVGHPLCIYLYPGKLGIRWYTFSFDPC